MTTPEAEAEGRRRAEKLLEHLSEGEDDAVDALLAEWTEVRDLVYVGAGLTVIARAEGRVLPTAQRAQASTRQGKLGEFRNSQRDDPAGLRIWLRKAGEEILFIRSLQAAVARLP
ncbi:hypothetical protein [Blastococcus sp. LR1]|uniref:hypothetical protein n=1 Tax=Blastococcus sp. LR1 TaxID=2877000 RepID=UPI001CCA63AB|nr:hypothetical protein [Blastococcus sp. LR1]MCA0144168.1 hypothetical protein [Blastococcus sp. LR1]